MADFNVSEIVSAVIGKVQENPSALTDLLKDPAKGIKELIGVSIPDDAIDSVVNGIKQGVAGSDGKLDLGDIANIAGDILGGGSDDTSKSDSKSDSKDEGGENILGDVLNVAEGLFGKK